MPSLKEFELNCNCKEIEIDDFNKMIIKLLSLDLNFILVITRLMSEAKQYSFKELKKLYPLLNSNNFKFLEIYKPYSFK